MNTVIQGKNVVIAGFKSVKVENVEEMIGEIQRRTKGLGYAQLLNAQLIAGMEHLYFAVMNAITAFKGGYNISRNLAVEVLLYSSAQHQISKAVNLMGIKPGIQDIAVVAIAESYADALRILRIVEDVLPGERDDHVLELTKEKTGNIIRTFGISRCEINAASRGLNEEETVKNLVIERMALLPAQR
ncbi:hypothetical protein CW702_02860 [Candidatus Bathyarchaeota archaeon]|nr:MAG: hypothetical protein CW702_02860 [Candidatus Bathyarchaeota archaeon]